MATPTPQQPHTPAPEGPTRPARRAGRREWTAFTVLMLPLLLVNMDVSVLYFAVPALNADLAPSSSQQLWILDIYAFMLAGLLITMGSLGDRIGPRRLLLLGAAAFGAASLLAAYATSPETLIVARALLGIGGATLMPSTLSLIRRIFENDRQRAIAIAIWSSVMAGGVALGAVLGGVLLEYFWWGSVFLINVPAMALLLLLTPLLVPEFRSQHTGRFDPLSMVLSLAAVLPVIYSIKEFAASATTWVSLLCLPAGLIMVALFIQRQRTHHSPMIDPELFRNRGLGPALTLNALGPFALVGSAFFTTQYLQMVLGMSPLEAALWSLVPSVGVAAAGPVAVQLAAARGRRTAITTGFTTAAIGFGTLTPLGTDHLAHILTSAGLLSAGVVMVLSQIVDLALGITPAERAGSVSALSETAAEFGGAVGVAILGSIGTAFYRQDIDHHLTDGTLNQLPADAGQAARETLGTAIHQATQLPAQHSEPLLHAAREAFVRGFNAAAIVGLVILTLAAATAHFALRHVPAANDGTRQRNRTESNEDTHPRPDQHDHRQTVPHARAEPARHDQ